PIEKTGIGLATFIEAASKGPVSRTVVFVPGKPGPWLEGVKHAASRLPRDAAGRTPLEFVVCTDGVDPARGGRAAANLAFRSPDDGKVEERVDAEELMQVVGALG